MNSQFKKGVLDLVVMTVLSKQDIYGYELVKQVCEVIQVKEGTIYPLLKRMTNEQYVDTYLQESTEGPPRKYYHLTEEGYLAMQQLRMEWQQFNQQINHFLDQEEKRRLS